MEVHQSLALVTERGGPKNVCVYSIGIMYVGLRIKVSVRKNK
jgi:hypothetical protein